MSRKARILLPLLPLISLSLLMEIAVRTGLVSEFVLPAPSQIILVLTTDTEELLHATGETLGSTFCGLAISLGVGMLIGIALATSRRFKTAFFPYTILFQTVPLIAVAPLLVIWFGFGQPSVIASAFIVSVFPIIANTVAGFEGTDPNLEELFTLYHATRKERWLKLKVPWAIPQILVGARVAVGLAVVGSIVGEFIAGGGLGAVIDIARTQQRLDKVFAAVLLASAAGLLAVAALDLISLLIRKAPMQGARLETET